MLLARRLVESLGFSIDGFKNVLAIEKESLTFQNDSLSKDNEIQAMQLSLQIW